MSLRHPLAVIVFVATFARAAGPPPGVVGKDGWLFYRYEAVDASVANDVKATVTAVARLVRVLAKNDVPVVVTLVPVKMRIYQQYLPSDFPITQHTLGQYQQYARALQAQKVPFIDLDSPFLASPKRDSDTPLFLHLDTHWSPTGAALAAETIKAGIDADPKLRAAVESVPAAKYRLTWETKKARSPANDLTAQLPNGAPKFEREPVLGFTVKREKAEGGLLDDTGPAITLLGSSYSADWTQFPAALRNALQRDVLSIAVPATQGSWIGMETYLRDDAFQTHRPKLIVWELPERDMHAPPDFRYREARYIVDNTDWLLRAAAWATAKCEPGQATAKAATGKLAEARPSKDGDWVEIAFTKPLERLEYVFARLTTHGASRIRLEATGPGSSPRKFELDVAGDDEPHNFKTPLGKGYDRLRITPGATHKFKLEDVRVCRQMEGLLD
jgi:alginate O-acetyltransferase complex protein AlgJ